MSTEPRRYEYRLGFRYAANTCAVDSGRGRPQSAIKGRIHRFHQEISSISKGHRGDSPISQNMAPRNGWELAAIQIQCVVRGWRARVWSVQVIHDRAWRALQLIQARWRGGLARHKLRHAAATFVEDRGLPRDDDLRKPRRSSRKHKIDPEQVKRCPERAEWEKTWARTRLGCPGFRDRIRVWQTIVELKRSGGRGRMGITNSEAWTALCDSSGSSSVAATLLSSEEHLLGGRLHGHVREIPPCLRLNRTALLVDGDKACPRQNGTSSVEGKHRDGKKRSQTVQQMRAEPGMGDVFECISTAFYGASTSGPKSAQCSNEKLQHQTMTSVHRLMRNPGWRRQSSVTQARPRENLGSWRFDSSSAEAHGVDRDDCDRLVQNLGRGAGTRKPPTVSRLGVTSDTATAPPLRQSPILSAQRNIDGAANLVGNASYLSPTTQGFEMRPQSAPVAVRGLLQM